MFWSFFASHESCWLSQILVWLVFHPPPPPPVNFSWITILMLVTKLRYIVLQICRTWTLDIFSRSTLAEFSNCQSALWIRYLNPFSGGWYVYRLVKVSVLVAEIWDSVKIGGGCKKDKHFSVRQSFSVGRVHHKINLICFQCSGSAACSEQEQLSANFEMRACGDFALSNLISQLSKQTGSRSVLVSQCCVGF